MMVKIRLSRRGRKKQAMYDVVIADVRAPRDGRFIAKIGTYNPNTNPATILIDEDAALQWLMNGAQPTDTVRAMLSYKGVLFKKHLQIGVNKGAITQEDADRRFEEWKNNKESKISSKKDSLSAQKEAEAKAKLEAERKINEARADALKQKLDAEEAARQEAERAKQAEIEAKAQAQKEAAEKIKEAKENATQENQETAE
ncbi:MAG: 30S ribosomal protein S16 [Microscillaceae bacterium]|nr:30S ribosomal protein S16 [Microscillaceae bacterium]